MSKKKRSAKELSHLRREVEFLKAQLKNTRIDPHLNYRAGEKGPTRSPKESAASVSSRESFSAEKAARDINRLAETANYSYLKTDLTRSLVLSLATLAVILGLYLLQRVTALSPLFNKFGI